MSKHYSDEIDHGEPIKYTGPDRVNIEYHHGQLRPAVGVNSVQVLRSNREHPEQAEGTGWTYNHAPMLAYHWGRFFLEYLSTPVEEHLPPGQTLLTSSVDGCTWETPRVVFPPYRVPDGVFEYDGNKLPSDTCAVMHQRMGFYRAPNGRLLILANYGISPTVDQVPFGRFSIGRVVREIAEPSGSQDTLGPIYFIRYNVNTVWGEGNTHYPLYTRSEDKGFREACEALMADPLVTQQWAEEQGDEDDLITLKSSDGGAFFNKAFCWYRIQDGTIVGLWKWMKAAVSRDEGRSWSQVADTPTIAHAGAKIWGQRTSDDRYALVHNPHTNNSCRWPLAVTTGDSGLVFDRMMLVIGDVPPKRYWGGPFKGLGFHYVRGLELDEGRSPDGALYVAYSVNKEDIWISRIPVPVTDIVAGEIHEDFTDIERGSWISGWNIYSPRWAPVQVIPSPDGGGSCLSLEDADPHDYAKAEKVFRRGARVVIDLELMAAQCDPGALYLELCDGEGRIPLRVVFGEEGALTVAHGRKNQKYMDYQAGRWYAVRIVADTGASSFDIEVDGRSLSVDQNYQGQGTSMKGWFFRAPAESLERVVLRTGPVRRSPTVDNLWSDFQDLPAAGEKSKPVRYFVRRLDIVSEMD